MVVVMLTKLSVLMTVIVMFTFILCIFIIVMTVVGVTITIIIRYGFRPESVRDAQRNVRLCFGRPGLWTLDWGLGPD